LPRVETSEFRQGLLSVCHSKNKANSEQALDDCIIIMLSLMNQKKYKCKFLLYRCYGENLLIFTYTHKTWLPKQGFHSKNYRTNNPCHRPVQQSLQTKKLNTSTKEREMFDVTRNSQKNTLFFFLFTSSKRGPK
jgi:hypothetical protein